MTSVSPVGALGGNEAGIGVIAGTGGCTKKAENLWPVVLALTHSGVVWPAGIVYA